MSMSDNISGHSSKSKNVNRTECSPFPLLWAAKNRLSISEMVFAQSLQKVWVVLKKSYLNTFTFTPKKRSSIAHKLEPQSVKKIMEI